MTGRRDFDDVARAWLDLMPAEAPDRAVAAILRAAETTPQGRRPRLAAGIRRFLLMPRLSLAAAAALVIVVLAGGVGAFVLSRPAGTGSSPAPSLASAAPASPIASGVAAAGTVPSALRASWFGGPRTIPGLAAGAGATLTIGASSVTLTPSNLDHAVLFSAGVTSSGSELQVTVSGNAYGCSSDPATYGYSLSPSGQTLTITAASDDCATRRAALAGTWWLADCRTQDQELCLGLLDPGTYRSQFFIPTLATGAKDWAPRFGALTFAVPDGWAGWADWPGEYGLTPVADFQAAGPGTDPAAKVLVFANAQPEAQSAPCSGKPVVGTAATPEAFVAWLRTVSTLQVGAATPITVGGFSGEWVDVDVTASKTPLCGVEFLVSGAWSYGGGDTGSPTEGIGIGERDRLILLDTGTSRLVAIVIHAPDSRFLAFIAQAMPIVQSFQFR